MIAAAQCLEVKMKTIGRADTKVMNHSAGQGDFVRFFRVAFVRNEAQLSPPPAPIFLSSVIFTPADRDASVLEIKNKIHEWVEDGVAGQYQAVVFANRGVNMD